jgi:glycine/D-amino acid oxidase-like deaminating enzyme
MADFDYAVIGKGLIGSAAARYLNATGKKVAIIGPDEPEDWANHGGVFASHYDQGRITRVLDGDIIWAVLAERSIQQYESLEQASSISFYYPVGGLQVSPASTEPENQLAQVTAVGKKLGVKMAIYEGQALKSACPLLDFPEEMAGILEPELAGYINPRSLIAAQLTLAMGQGAVVIREQVVALQKGKTAVEIRLANEQSYTAQRVLVAAGAYTNLLLERPLALELKARTIVLAELPAPEVERLKRLPTLIYRLAGNPRVDSIYMLPPILYPDGRYYIKIGGGHRPLIILEQPEALADWFRSGGSQTEAEALQEILLALIPDLQATSFHFKPCVTTYTPHNHPFVDVIEDGQIFVATGGCGSAAKSSNEIGRMAALLVEHGEWQYDLKAESFKAVEAEK